MKQNHSRNLQKKTFDTGLLNKKKVYIDSAHTIHSGLGKGVFAKRDIKKGETVFIIKGKRVRVKIKGSMDSALFPNAISLDKEVWLDPYPDNPLLYLNHSCSPNAALRGHVTVVALKPIKKNEHITIDYSITEWDKLWMLNGQCLCGAKNCRKKIRSIHYLPKQTYDSYLPFIPKFLQKEYESSR